MRRINFWLTMAILAGFAAGRLMLAGASPLWRRIVHGPKQTIINHSGYPENQIYLVFYGANLTPR